jgi:hypothetical protein
MVRPRGESLGPLALLTFIFVWPQTFKGSLIDQPGGMAAASALPRSAAGLLPSM